VADISVTFCSRGRPESLRDAVYSLKCNAEDWDEVEVFVAVDPDDSTVLQASELLAEYGMGDVNLWAAPERYGYQGLHKYLNDLSQFATGTWQMWFNDDARMQTQGWDSAIRSQQEEAILWPRANHVLHANLFPIWPRRWTEHVGMVTPTMHMDTWLQYVGEALGRHVQIPVEIFHDRADVTGNHNDDTYHEGRELMGPEGMAPDFQQVVMREFPVYMAKLKSVL
jgi:hypothetical protein